MIPTRRVTVGDGALAYRAQRSGEPLLLLHSGFIADSMLPLLDQPSASGSSDDRVSPSRIWR